MRTEPKIWMMETVMQRHKVKPRLNFDPNLFTDIYRKIENASTRFVLIWGGASASKSYSMMQYMAIQTFKDKGDWLVIRKHNTSVEHSVWDGTKEIIDNWGFHEDFEYRRISWMITNKHTGTRIIMKGLDDPEKIKSMFGIKYIYIEEINQLEERDFLELNRRVRGIPGIRIYGLFNPIVITHWIKKKIFDVGTYQDQLTSIHCTYKDAVNQDGDSFLTEDDIINLENLQFINENDFKVYVKGEWGSVRTGQEYYSKFHYIKQVKECRYIDGLPVHISFDQNVVPYITATIWQIYELDSLYYAEALQEYCLENPLNNTESLCRKILEEWEPALANGLYYYGDATGRNRDTRGRENDYDIVERVMTRHLNNRSCRVPARNPLHKRRREFINEIFVHKYPIRMIIDPSCEKLITDLELVKEDPTGGKFKPTKKDPGGASYEELGHTSDTMDYFLMKAFQSFIE